MKILHVITSLSTGGAEHLLVDMLPRLRDMGHTVEIAVFKSKRTTFYEQIEQAEIKIHGFSEEEGFYNYKHIFRLKKLMKKFDIVHTHNTACQMFAAIGKPKNVKLVTTEHSTSTRRRKFKFFHAIDCWMYSRYDKIICISEPSENSLRNYIGSDYPITTIHNGIDVNRFAEVQKINLGLPDCIIITMVAGFRYEKDQPTLIRAMQHLPEKYHLQLVGDGERRSEFENLITKLNLENRVHLLGIRNDVPQILRSSDIIVMSSHREGLSLSNVEGMSSGNPFVASDVEGLREVTKGYGVLFPHGDDKKLASIIRELSEDKEYNKQIAVRCLRRAKMFDIQKMVNEYNQLYLDLIANN